jgi:hypothetical protein
MTKHAICLLSGTILLAAATATAAPQKGRSHAKPSAHAPFGASRDLPRNEGFTAAHGMAAMMGTGPMDPCPNPGANPVTGNASADLSVPGVACGGGGITTENTYARVFTQAQIGTAYTVNCVNFGLDNSGSPLPGTIALWRDPTGGDPSINEVELIASFEVTLTTGEDQLLAASGDPVCVTLSGDETLVVTMDYPESTDGFCTFAGGTTAVSPTYILSASCGLSEFAPLSAIGFPNNQWFVELSGDFGCEGGLTGDLNDDGLVDGADIAILLGAWGTADPVADLTGDGNVDGADLAIVLGNWTS